MPDRPLECLRCRGPMEQGFIMDKGHYSVPDVARWVEGEPRKSFWRGLDTRDRAVRPLESWRCERCGYVEFYARTVDPA